MGAKSNPGVFLAFIDRMGMFKTAVFSGVKRINIRGVGGPTPGRDAGQEAAGPLGLHVRSTGPPRVGWAGCRGPVVPVFAGSGIVLPTLTAALCFETGDGYCYTS